MAGLNFNANEVDPDAGFDAVPAGKYLVAITESEMKPTKNKQGSYLELVCTVLEGDYKGRKVWVRLNLENKSGTAVNIARSQLSAICYAVGVMKLKDSVQLHNLPLVITVKCRKDDSGDIQNDVKKFEKVPAGQTSGKPLASDAESPGWM